MSMGMQIHLDTNFFIGGFHHNPQSFQRFAQIVSGLGYELFITNYVERELRWYLRRSILPHVKVIRVGEKELTNFEAESRQVVGSLPQTPDMSVIFVAHSRGGVIVSSDLKLIQVAENLGVKSMVNSAFVLGLLEEVTDPADKEILTDLYERLFADEVSYSVRSKDVYDPVIRIRKIMDSAITVLSSHTNKSKHEELEIPEEIPEESSDIAIELRELVKELRTDLSEYLAEAEKGNIEPLHKELSIGTSKLLDLLVEYHTLGAPASSPLFQEGISTLGHLFLLLSSLEIALQDPFNALKRNDELLMLMLQSEPLTKMLELEVHLQRIILLLLNKKLDRLRGYFTPAFMQKCIDSERSDVQNLLNVVSVLTIVLANRKPEVVAIPKTYDDVEFVMQLGFQFSAIGNLEDAMLILEQAFHMAVNAQMIGVGIAIIEYMAPINLALEGRYDDKLRELYETITETDPSFSGYDIEDRISIKRQVPEEFIRKRYVKASSLHPELTSWLDVLGSQEITFKSLGKVKVIKAVNWNVGITIGIIDKQGILPSRIGVGSAIKIESGKFASVLPPKTLVEKAGLDLIIIPHESVPLRIFVRRAGVVSIASSKAKLIAYDL